MSRGNIVVDASAVHALVTFSTADSQWVADEIDGARLLAPTVMPYEVGNALRRRLLAGELTETQATDAHADLGGLPVKLWPYAHLAQRAWELRASVTYYDAAYVALAEKLGAPLVTLDGRLSRANGPRCEIRTPPQSP